MSDEFGWLLPWEPVAETGGVAGQLRAEMAPGHVLEGESSIETLARRGDTDDALFLLSDGRVAEVHLTWSSSREVDPRWPITTIYPSLAEWARLSMIPDHQEWDE